MENRFKMGPNESLNHGDCGQVRGCTEASSCPVPWNLRPELLHGVGETQLSRVRKIAGSPVGGWEKRDSRPSASGCPRSRIWTILVVSLDTVGSEPP